MKKNPVKKIVDGAKKVAMKAPHVPKKIYARKPKY